MRPDVSEVALYKGRIMPFVIQGITDPTAKDIVAPHIRSPFPGLSQYILRHLFPYFIPFGRSAVGKAFRLAHQQGKIVSLDPNYSSLIWPDYKKAQQVIRAMYRYATITKPSLDDAQRFFGPGYSPEQYIRMFHELGPRTVILTMGKEGALISRDGELLGHVPARPVKVVDATAAGDAFWAGFLVALLDGHSLERCVLFAREIAELKLTTVGPLPLTIDREQIYARLPNDRNTTKIEE